MTTTSTLAHNERQWAPATVVVLVTCAALGAALMARAWQGPQPAAIACLLAWALLSGSNVRYLVQHGHTTVGMMPVSVFSLAPACTAALASGALAGAWPVVCGALLALSLGTVGLFALWFWRMRAVGANVRDVADDALVIVLGGAVRQGRPCRTLALRLDAARRVWQAHPRCTLLLTGGPVAGGTETEADAMARYLEDGGVPRERMVLERRARNTRENVRNALALARRRGLVGRPCVLTSDYHLYRAVREGRALGADLTPLAAPTPRASRLQQWCREVLTILSQRWLERTSRQ